MPHSFGIRARTRSMFSRNFREKGVIALSTYLKTYKVGDIVDIVANGAINSEFNKKNRNRLQCFPTSVGVIINKRVGNRYIEKRVNIRVEHVKHSKCREDFLNRVKENARLRPRLRPMERLPEAPREARFVQIKNNEPVFVSPAPYETLI
ncbi:60S ribosomal protein L21A [Entomophthora muscae]|uniref:60S ribosomal protein L21A n=1 Tax=Entomophthora muscae TaxID=34485 RepID=A0ACC2SYY3_9FUNG|nr:60S ribosomal protein L21A [Entomophthora muscae]